MSESKVSVTEGSGKNLRTWDRTISSVLVQEQVTHIGEPYLPTYTVIADGVGCGTSDTHLLQLMAGSSLHVRLLRITVWQNGLAGAANILAMNLNRLTSAGNTGTTQTPRPHDTGDAACGATALSAPSNKGDDSGGITLVSLRLAMATAQPAAGYVQWSALDRGKPIIIPAGTSNGVALVSGSTITSSPSVNVVFEFTETAWL